MYEDQKTHRRKLRSTLTFHLAATHLVFIFLYFIIPTFTVYFINILTTAILIILYIFTVYILSILALMT
jgi:hypothetical protein